MKLRLTIIGVMLFLYTMAQTNELQTATLGSGCFWCTEAIFEQVKGVSNIKPGYAGGHVNNPSYKEVCNGTTGHAEVIQLYYDPAIISYAEILEIYFKMHDPTQLNRQGNDIGTQYRSVIFYHTQEQKQIATDVKDKLEHEMIWENPIVTIIEEYNTFYVAEDYHNNYYSNNPNQGYCRFVITPKVEKFEKVFKDYLNE
jgi:peptide-methionine (S)-S-oxide reductase